MMNQHPEDQNQYHDFSRMSPVPANILKLGQFFSSNDIIPPGKNCCANTYYGREMGSTAILLASSHVSDRRRPVKRGYTRALGHGNSSGDVNGGIKLNEDGG